ncbi:MAG: efflux RND transporter periplasmic adaptor subunit [Planctomycetota bacterium]|nr:efflux RND transporter periplasmic adaptor subunit [Planctomycetota bacterium]
MKATKSIEQNQGEEPRPMVRKLVGASVKVLVSVLIVAGAVAIYRHQINTSPRVGRKKPPRQAKLVQVIRVRKSDCTTTVRADGTVMPAQQVTLRPQVTGQVVELPSDIVPGGIVGEGHKLMGIDRRDYDILVRQRRYDVIKALRDLKVEQGNQAIAKQEYELLGEVIAEEDRELVLRQPQLESARAAHESAQAALERARLDLARCEITVPFNAIIRERRIDLGATVSLNSDLVTLIGTDEAWIEAKVWVDQLKWLTIPREHGDQGSNVKIYDTLAWGADRFRSGRVVCLLGELETRGQLARVLVAVDDPFCLKPENSDLPQLLMGSYISAEIEGRTLASVFAVDRSHLRENGNVWIMDDAGRLDIRPVQIGFRGTDRVYVTAGLAENERLVATDIAAPVQGMPLRLAPKEGRTSGDNRASRQKGGR